MTSADLPSRRFTTAALTLTAAVLAATLLLAATTATATPAAPTNPPAFHPPIGPHTALKASNFNGVPSFLPDERVVLTPYFYWYDVYSGEHLFNADGSDALTDHPPTLTGFSYRSPAWHQQQLEDMEEAGIDVVLPVYWGEPSARRPGRPVSEHPWSYAGIPPLVAARETLLAQGRTPPRIGLFYDTSTLQFNEAGERIDLTTDRGRHWFYETIRDFFSLVPPRHWAMIDGKPIIFLYSSSFATRHDESCIQHLRTAFAAEFGGRTPFVVREISWNAQTEQVYAWGGALGLKNPGTASIGPGYDHSAVPGRDPLVVPRENGAFYRDNWLRFLRRPSPLVFLETWNEFHEGTQIAHSREYGRQYIAATRHFVDLFKAGYRPPRLQGPHTDARSVEVLLDAADTPAGVSLVPSADGLTEPATLAGQPCRVLVANPHGPRYAYFRIEESFKWADAMDVLVVLDFFDAQQGTLQLEFDGSDPRAPFNGAYTPAPPIALQGTRTWRTATIRLTAARFLNAQNSGADFRIGTGQVPLGIRRVQVIREGLKALRVIPSEGCELQVFAAPGRLYDLESSPDLQTWTLHARLKPANGVSRYLAPFDPSTPHLWFRLRQPPG